MSNAAFKGNTVHSLDSHREEKEPRKKKKKSKLTEISVLSFAVFSWKPALVLQYNFITLISNVNDCWKLTKFNTHPE